MTFKSMAAILAILTLLGLASDFFIPIFAIYLGIFLGICVQLCLYHLLIKPFANIISAKNKKEKAFNEIMFNKNFLEGYTAFSVIAYFFLDYPIDLVDIGIALGVLKIGTDQQQILRNLEKR